MMFHDDDVRADIRLEVRSANPPRAKELKNGSTARDPRRNGRAAFVVAPQTIDGAYTSNDPNAVDTR